jgi:hypothetical protein
MPRHAALGSLQRLEETGEELVANSRTKPFFTFATKISSFFS